MKFNKFSFLEMNSIFGSIVIILTIAGSVVGTDNEIMTILRSLQTKLDGLEIKIKQTITEGIRNKTCTAIEIVKVSNLATASELRKLSQNLTQHMNGLSMKVDSYRDEVQNSSAKTLHLLDLHLNSTQPGDSVHIRPNSTPNNQSLKAVVLTTKLSSKLRGQAVSYDGDDAIYLLGGTNENRTATDQILLFSISSQNMTRIGSLPEPSTGRSVQWDKDHKNIFYFGGSLNGNKIYKFDPKTKTSSTVAQLPYNVIGGSAIKYNETSNTVYIFGGWGQEKELLTFDMDSLTSSKVANLSNHTFGATSVRVGNKAFIYGAGTFGRYWSQGANTLLEWNLDTFAMRQVGDPNHPKITEFPSSVGDGSQFIYLFGGYEPTSSFATNGITQFDPVTMQSRFIPVENFSVEKTGSYYYFAPDCAFVNKSNRIYCFGGSKKDKAGYPEPLDDIFYIDLISFN